jgi:selenocysteine lyase/cysteine desulfurase
LTFSFIIMSSNANSQVQVASESCSGQWDLMEPASTLGSGGAHSSELSVLSQIEESIIGRHRCFPSPFGDGCRRIVYADYTASGRAVEFIERYLVEEVLPVYANTHTAVSFTGLQTTHFREQARDILHRGMNGKANDVVLFVGNGTTAAVGLLVHVLCAAAHVQAFRQLYGSKKGQKVGHPLVVIHGPYEHHSNILPWREAGALCISIDEQEQGGLDLADLRTKANRMAQQNPHALLIGTFSAASNVSGILTGTVAVTRILHQYGFLACWDYASAAPYKPIDANPLGLNGEPDLLAAVDAIMFSPHKFVGGPGASGVVLLKRHMFRNSVPFQTGGGTVRFVIDAGHAYVRNPEERELGGTPGIIGDIRAALAWNLKAEVGAKLLESREELLYRRGLDVMSSHPCIALLGSPNVPRLPIFSFLVRFKLQPNRFLHGGFVSSLLNDLFGVQTRSGCMCAGPYGLRELSMTDEAIASMNAAVHDRFEVLKPAYSRFNLAFFASEAEVEYILSAVTFVADHGWRFLPLYKCDVATAQWTHYSIREKGGADLADLDGVHLLPDSRTGTGTCTGTGARISKPQLQPLHDEEQDSLVVFSETMRSAHTLLGGLLPSSPWPGREVSLPKGYACLFPCSHPLICFPAQYHHLQWFLLPEEALEWVLDPNAARQKEVPVPIIRPKDYGQSGHGNGNDPMGKCLTSQRKEKGQVLPIKATGGTDGPASAAKVAGCQLFESSTLSPGSLPQTRSSVAYDFQRLLTVNTTARPGHPLSVPDPILGQDEGLLPRFGAVKPIEVEQRSYHVKRPSYWCACTSVIPSGDD